jgi:pilus assembly protein CpaD
MSKSANNDVQPNFGCAVTANMALMVANPNDLLRPTDSGPSDAGRRMTVLEKYREGKVTSSEKDEQAKGSVSQAVK